MNTISSIRFSFTRKGNLRGEVTVANPTTGEPMYLALANVLAAVKAAKAAGAEVRGYKRTIPLKSAQAIADNGGVNTAVVAEYATTPCKFAVTVLGAYAEIDTASVTLAGATAADATEAKALVQGIALQEVAPRKKPNDSEAVDLG